MRLHAPVMAGLLLAFGCEGTGDRFGDRTAAVRVGATALISAADPSGEPSRERASGRLLVVRLGDGVEVLRSRALRRAPRGMRRVPRRWKGRWEVRSGDGRVLSDGRFRIPRRRHVLLGDVGGPARAVDVALERPVVWLRIRMTTEARVVVLYDDHGRRRLGEVAL